MTELTANFSFSTVNWLQFFSFWRQKF